MFDDVSPSRDSQPPSPHGDAAVPISSVGPSRLNSVSEKCRNNPVRCLVKNARSQLSAWLTCVVHTVPRGPLDSGEFNAAQSVWRNGLNVMRRPAVKLRRATKVCSSLHAITFVELNFWRSSFMSLRICSLIDAVIPPSVMVRVPPIHTRLWADWPLWYDYANPIASHTRIMHAFTRFRSEGLPTMTARGSSTKHNNRRVVDGKSDCVSRFTRAIARAQHRGALLLPCIALRNNK